LHSPLAKATIGNHDGLIHQPSFRPSEEFIAVTVRKQNQQPTRRQFLAASAATAATPLIVRSSVFAHPAPSDRVVVGSIGTGDLGRRHHLANMLLPNPRVRVGALCDVDRRHREEAAQIVLEKTGHQVEDYRDFRDLCDRQDIDAVLIAVPDHWHALIAQYAIEAGKDVYCEKPLTYTIDEGKKLVAAARRYGTVFQTGSQQRSDRRFRLACELVRNGKIGTLQRVDTHIGEIDSGSWEAASAPPAELDWNFWLGPAPWSEYVKNKVHYQFRWFSDYSGGKMTDWGAHHNDIAQWGIGADGSGPVKVQGSGTFHPNGPHDVPGTFDVKYTYAGGVELHCHAAGENGAKFTGSDGTVFVSRGRIELVLGGKSYPDYESIVKEFNPEDFQTKLQASGHHHDNWLDCIASRERPICDVEIGHRSCTVCHLGNIAIKLNRELTWDPAAEQFVGDDEAARLVSKPKRAPWVL
jgi:predicted dehydrogenase